MHCEDILKFIKQAEVMALMAKPFVVNIGSKNVAKVAAVDQTLKEYELFKDVKIVGIEASSGISEQPLSMDETIEGAKNRAKNCFKDCDYSIGLESGLMKVPHTKSGYMNIDICAIFDGKMFHLGMGPAFEYPKKAIDIVFRDNKDMSQAFKVAGFTDHDKLGNTEGGIVGKLTKGRCTRKEYTRIAIIMAMIHLENPELY